MNCSYWLITGYFKIACHHRVVSKKAHCWKYWHSRFSSLWWFDVILTLSFFFLINKRVLVALWKTGKDDLDWLREEWYKLPIGYIRQVCGRICWERNLNDCGLAVVEYVLVLCILSLSPLLLMLFVSISCSSGIYHATCGGGTREWCSFCSNRFLIAVYSC